MNCKRALLNLHDLSCWREHISMETSAIASHIYRTVCFLLCTMASQHCCSLIFGLLGLKSCCLLLFVVVIVVVVIVVVFFLHAKY